ncbi:hypothetical protein V490_05743 [Pseudogymnoascus sp. VKM F-3557]|nr:hypothetical protein V490_05743 [Pseudogymnoascus sp. VKM F-3557]
MDPLDLSSLAALAPPLVKRDRASKSIPISSGIKQTIGIDVGQAKPQNHSAPLSCDPWSHDPWSRGSWLRPKPTLPCPFHKHDPLKFNYQYCAKLWPSIHRLKKHIFGQHTDQFLCRACNRRFDSQDDIQSHNKEMKLCGLDPQPRLPKDITPATLLALRKTQGPQKPKTPEEEWQDIYQLLFPGDDSKNPPNFEFSAGLSGHGSESAASNASNDVTPSMITAPAIGSEVQYAFSHAHTSKYLRNLPESPVDQEAEGIERRIQTLQAPIMKDISLPMRTPKDSNFLMIRYLRDDETSLQGESSPPTGGDFGAELSPSNSRESLSGTSEQSTELCEEDQSQFSDSDSIDSGTRTYLSFSLGKRTIFDREVRRFWSFYNGLSVSYWFHLWEAHKTRTKAASEHQDIQRGTRTSSDTRGPSEYPSNYTSPIAPKRKKRDDEDEPNSNRNPPKRPNRTSLQKEGLNLACPFHKYKPWKYNHGILRFRTCSTTPFDAIFRLKEHLRRVHPPPLHCTRCWDSFTDQNSLVNHSQADIPCQRRQPVSIEGWTPEMDKKMTKRKDETERERWERIYRELFGKTLADVPSPYFVPYDLPSANEADLQTLLHQEVPRIVLNLMREKIDNWETSHVERFLYTSLAMFPLHTMIGSAIEEAFQIYRSATAADNPEAPLTPKSSSANPSIAGDSSSAQSATWESTSIDPLQASGDQFVEFGFFPAVAPNDTMHPRTARGSPYSGHIREQAPQPAAGLVPQTSEAASSSFVPNLSGQLRSTEEYMQQGSQQDATSAYGASMDDYMFVNLDFEGDFDNEAFLNVSSGPYGASARS